MKERSGERDGMVSNETRATLIKLPRGGRSTRDEGVRGEQSIVFTSRNYRRRHLNVFYLTGERARRTFEALSFLLRRALF